MNILEALAMLEEDERRELIRMDLFKSVYVAFSVNNAGVDTCDWRAKHAIKSFDEVFPKPDEEE